MRETIMDTIKNFIRWGIVAAIVAAIHTFIWAAPVGAATGEFNPIKIPAEMRVSDEELKKALYVSSYMDEAYIVADDPDIVYVWGGAHNDECTPDESTVVAGAYGYDCSSFVRHCLLVAGIDVPHFTTAIEEETLLDCGFEVVEDEPEYGDVLLWNGHTEFFVGNGISIGAHATPNASLSAGDSISEREGIDPGYIVLRYVG